MTARSLNKAFVLPAAAVLLILLILAVLLYRWSNQISEAASVRLADSLQMSMTNWRLNLYRDIADIPGALRVDSENSGNLDLYARRFREWSASAQYRKLAEAVYVFEGIAGESARCLRLDDDGRAFHPAECPVPLASLVAKFKRAAAGPKVEDPPFPRGLAGWRFEPETLTLVRAIDPDRSRWLTVKLDPGVIENRILPDLAKRYFMGVDGLDYQIAVVSADTHPEPVYSSDPGFGAPDVADADGRLDVFGSMTARRFGSPVFVFHAVAADARSAGPAGSLGPSWFPLLDDGSSDHGWQLVVRHRRGGALGAFAEQLRRRDLAISFGVLFLLLVSVSMLILASLRANRLARLQVDFVTAVSHELRSPLAIISSAAENIAHGVVEDGSRIKQYGAAIERQSRRLSMLVEEVLLFAATRESQHRYNLRPLEVMEIVEAALAGTADLIEASQFVVESDVPEGLPRVNGDLSALSQCLQNLVTNALKYSGGERWIGIRARVHDDAARGREVWVDVSDRGIGIDAKELPRIFEPFYRSSAAASMQAHGTGLGLSLARNIAEAMRGELTVMSRPGAGATFTLRLPAIQAG